jgi:hypothetical protein
MVFRLRWLPGISWRRSSYRLREQLVDHAEQEGAAAAGEAALVELMPKRTPRTDAPS